MGAVKRDTRTSIKLSSENLKEIKMVHKWMMIPLSVNAFTNFIIERYGIPALKESTLFKDATK